MSVLFQSVLWIGLPLVAVPLLIHLINLRRQRRIRWAAMQFLLESQRRNRRWILLKQFLLMLARMAAIAVLVFMLARLSVRNEWLRLLGRGTTHHVVLLDDSYSMSDRWGDTSALDEGKRAVRAIVGQAARQPDRQLVTLLTFTEAERLSAGSQPQVFAEPINDALGGRLEAALAACEVSQTDAGPAAAVAAVRRLPLAESDHSLIVYLVSDFRKRQFADAAELRDLLADLDGRAQLHFVSCVREWRPNLAITALAPASGIRAAGVEMWMNVTVRNYGDSPASGVTVQVQQDGDALPALALDDVPPGQELTHTFRVQFAGPGAHWLSGALGTDAVAIDNHRYFASLLPAARPVLIIEGSPNSRDGRQLALALAPGGNTPTGWQPHVEPSRFLVDEERLKRQAAVCLLDVPRLAEDELAALEKYVRDGGGVAVFVGAQTQRGYYNDRLYRNGEGLFPAPLRLPTQLLDRSGDSLPDVDVSDHVLFKILAGRRNSYLELLMVDYYYAVADDWSPAPDGDTRVIARLRNGAPLVVEKQLGRGRVVAQLTKVSAEDTPLGPWTNWSSNPVFPVLANELVNYLAAGSDSDELFNVGDNLVVAAAEAEYEPAVRIVLPREGPSPAELPLDAAPAAGMLVAELPAIAASGVYHALLQKREGGLDRRSYAFNVAAGEGDLELASRAEISRRLEGVDFQWHDSADMRIEDAQLAGLQLGDTLLGALIALLLGEQLLAYSASYHIRV